MNVKQAYLAFKTADEAWQSELVRVWGKHAGDARYTNAGQATPELKALHASFQQAGKTWRELMRLTG